MSGTGAKIPERRCSVGTGGKRVGLYLSSGMLGQGAASAGFKTSHLLVRVNSAGSQMTGLVVRLKVRGVFAITEHTVAKGDESMEVEDDKLHLRRANVMSGDRKRSQECLPFLLLFFFFFFLKKKNYTSSFPMKKKC